MINEEILKKLQQTELQILKDVVALCNKNNIRYYLIAGTLLGEERHKGFIPWDDDIDIAMPREDYNKFQNVFLNDEINNNYFLQNIYTDSKYHLTFTKIRKNNTLFKEKEYDGDHQGIFIDIFPLDYIKRKKGIRTKIKNTIVKDLTQIAYIRKVGGKTVSAINKILFIMTLPLSIKQIIVIRDKIASFTKKGKYVANYSSWYNIQKEIYDLECWEPSVLGKFENEMFRIPAKKEYILKQIFGDYMKLPPENERVNHSPEKIEFDCLEEKNEV